MKTLWKCIWYFLTVYDKVCGDSRVSACSYAGTSHSSVFHGTDLIPSAFTILILSAFSQVFPPFFLLTVYSTKPLSHWYRIMNQPRPACNNRAVLFFYSCTFTSKRKFLCFIVILKSADSLTECWSGQLRLLTYLGTGDFSLLDHDEGRGDEGALSHVIYRVVGHGLQEIDGLLWQETQKSRKHWFKYTTFSLFSNCRPGNYSFIFNSNSRFKW